MSPRPHHFSKSTEGSLTASTAVRMDGRIRPCGVKMEPSMMSHTDPIVGYAVVVVQLSFALLIRPVVVTPS
jgi:hypothetical protein